MTKKRTKKVVKAWAVMWLDDGKFCGNAVPLLWRSKKEATNACYIPAANKVVRVTITVQP